MTEQTTQPTAEERAKMQAVATAGAQAAANAPQGSETDEAKRAMRAEADEQKLKLSDEEIDAIATVFVGKTIAEFEQRGAFDAPAEPVTGPAAAQAPPPPTEQQAQAGQAAGPAEQPPTAPQKRSWAQRYMGT